MLRIEYEEPTQVTCACCGAASTRLTRFVYRDGDAWAVYFASYSETHPERLVRLLVSLGEWGEGSSPDQRRAFSLALRAGPTQFEVMVTDAADSPWADAEFTGRGLSRNDALADPWLPEAFHISDHAVLEDPVLRRYLDAE
ncbi:MAG: hypothetical protein ACO1SX_29230 [Actinomycetota bacterium]